LTDTAHFHLEYTDPATGARRGILETAHGFVPTPVFMPVGSQGSVKTLSPEELHDRGITIILANAYHLYLRPGNEVLQQASGLHNFMAWDGAILTDSGGFQIFSLSALRKTSDEGVLFRSHIDGSEHFLTPETMTHFQEGLGVDVMMALDECIAHDASYQQARAAMERTHRWAQRCQAAQSLNNSAQLFAIVQGGMHPDLRRESAAYLAAQGFTGYAIGGLSLGETKEVTWSMLDIVTSGLPANKPRYLMGVGSPEDIFEGVSRGVDLFDSVLPTRVARNGAFFTREGRRNIHNFEYRNRQAPLDPHCNCYTCRHFSAAYLSHLFNTGELLAYRLATIHNLHFMQSLMTEIREAIGRGSFFFLRREFLTSYRTTDETTRLAQKEAWHRSQKPIEDRAP
jgi:queuine tRNA-ribosyltransferase